eukprot:TRINITY_DN30474_c0_g1_i1.p1 TRINITY_DN30474_c0_g1~~TRINITY_DN30474_c0_g1_i1.p1  ORF type:complete len:301 (-),score=45.97 TRINITY_DN30474_c0_g1_i1:137-1039(-)
MVTPHCLKVACLQMSPVHGQVRDNIARADKLLKARKKDLEGLRLLVLPEMAFTGYHWRSRVHIDPHLEEDETSGPSAEWCKRTAAQLGCVVCCGVPRRSKMRRLNSVLVAGPDGKLIDVIDKRHLYASDKTWAEAGDEFRVLERLPGIPLGPVGFGICMDINPRDFQVGEKPYEFAEFNRLAGSRLIIFSSAWCRNHPEDVPEAFDVEKSDEQVSQETLDQWMRRLQPLRGKDVYFVCADRVGGEALSLLGQERELVNRFCGTSCVISFRDGSVLKALSASEEGVLVFDIPLKEDAPIFT